jgi:S1-C subfamily serine protease
LGSGVVIDGQWILTSAHLVTYWRKIDIQPFQSSEKFSAKVTILAPDINLALLEIDDKKKAQKFFNDRLILKLDDRFPRVKQRLRLLGYPTGNDALRAADGAISRIQYAGGGLKLEVAAKIFPGISGGPAIVNDKIVGLVYGASTQGKSVGYVLPSQEIATFLKDASDGKYDGKPGLWVELQSLENKALRDWLGLDDDVRGVLVRADHRNDPDYPLKKGDVITKIGDYKIDNDGMVRLKNDDLRLPFSYLVPKLARNKTIRLEVLRQGAASASTTIDVPVEQYWDFIIPSLNSGEPSYFVWGPLCFCPASKELVSALSPHLAEQWGARGDPLATRRLDVVAFPGEQLVMVTMMLQHKTSKGYGSAFGQTVERVNDVRIKNLRHLVETLRDTKEKHVVIEFAGKSTDTLVFDREAVKAAMPTLLRDYAIPERVSPDLRDVWQPKKKLIP